MPKDAPKSAPTTPGQVIRLRGCRQHNLQGFDLDIPLGKLSVVTGPSGSGKSSLAFHTLYAEGQRRYVETFSPYVRQFFDRMDKPDVDSIEGIPPAIAIEQKNHVRTTRSTVGTLTEINDYLKLLFARLAIGYDPYTGETIQPDSPESAAAWAFANFAGQSVHITFALPVPPEAKPEEIFPILNQQGYLRVLIGGKIHRTDEPLDSGTSGLGPQIHVLQDRLKVTPENQSRLLEALEAAFRLGKGHATVHLTESSGLKSESSRSFSTSWTNPATGFTLRPPTAALFSFNSPLGACPKCRGFGRVIGIDLEKTIPDKSLSIAQGAIKPFQGERGDECLRDLVRNCKERGIDTRCPVEDLTEAELEWIYYGDRKTENLTPEQLEDLWQSGNWYGIKGFFDWLETKAYKMQVRIFLSRYRSYTTCSECRGRRLQPESLCFKIEGKTLPELWAMSISDLLPWFSALVASSAPLINEHTALGTPDATLKLVLTEITSRLSYLDQVGLGYLTLDRTTRTLSGGEVERVNLTTCLGASLTGTLFVLDEPTVGLHPRDIDRLVGVMHSLRDKGNTLVVVEHEQAVMQAADQLIDIGPAAGSEGGTLIYQGPVTGGGVPGDQSSVTGARGKKKAVASKNISTSPAVGTLPWLTGAKSIPVPASRRKPSKKVLSIKGATRHNLRKLDAEIPLGLFVCLTGVSGSGKSTFAHDVLYLNLARKLGQEAEGDAAPIKSLTGSQHLASVELVDQTAVARTPRSTPAVFLGAFDPIRQLFALTPEARARELTTGFFSFNSGAGRCDRCAGNGFEKVEMQFLSDLYVTCPDCNGKRYKPSTLDYHYLGKSIHDILDLTVANAIAFYSEVAGLIPAHAKRHQQIVKLLEPLVQVGLGYLKLGQPLNTLSGGEAQRLKLCQLLASTETQGSARGKLLILDEPTTGLHFSDIENLLTVFQKLVDSGHTLLVIEHNLDVIKSADWLLDLGPEAGKHGGQLVATGPPEQVAKLDTPTAGFLKQALAGVTKGAEGSTGSSSSLPLPNPELPASSNSITLRGARHHNLKNISLDIPRDQLVVISGLSGSGKSTLAFDILFAEGQRRFLDSMSAYARQFAEQLEKPEIDQLQGLPPTVAIEQRISQGGGKSTVATVTELWNFIRLLYSKLGTLYCPDCHVPVEKQSLAAIENTIRDHLKSGAVRLLAPIIRGKKGFHTEIAEWAVKQGFTSLLVDGGFQEASTFTRLERFKEHDIDVVVAEVSNDRQPVAGRKVGKKNASSHVSSSSPVTDHLDLHTLIPRALDIGKGIIKLHTADGKIHLLSTHSNCPSCNQSFEELDPRLFSFNSPHGWCPECRGHGRVPKRRQHLDTSRFDTVLEAEMDADRAIDRMESNELTECPACHGSRLNPTASAVRLQGSPPAGGRGGRFSTPISALGKLSINSATTHFTDLTFTDSRDTLIARDILPEIRQRLTFLQEVGLGYLQLDRSGNTLSGGESQRIRLAAQLGSNLRGVLYVLDEPTIGLHPRDNAALLKTLISLRDQGNSLIIVEHDEDTIVAADHLIDLGPGAGRLGGEIVYQGKPPEIPKAPGDLPPVVGGKGRKKHSTGNSSSPATDHPVLAASSSPTYRALSAVMHHPLRGSRRAVGKDHPFLTLAGCHANNLKNVDVAIPLGRLTVLTGISGSGKSSLMHSCIAALFKNEAKTTRVKKSELPFGKTSGEKLVKATFEVDQSPIGKTSRSCPATYVKVFDHIRALFAQLPEARMRGFDASRFSFNTEGGRCPDCKGNGRVKLEMDFLPSTWVHCETCNGQRYNPATLEVTFRQKNIGEVLAMTIDDAAAFFESQPRISHPLKLMADTGLGYLQLGQASPTLSGGEAQRIKLVSELTKGRGTKATLNNAALTQRNLYLIEEPTVGLHLEDVQRLIDVLHRLADEGHTVVVIEHHMAVAAEADWILDLGPEAGEAGGQIIAQGTPEKVAKSKTSRTAPFLKTALRI
ncbi:excinuclease ABC subunit UvrA [Luteolibacter yonseiensis]|uniref:excinuclease ABC subunit UvrA n=1 Tax=Luteolibacter yonseiensis TaxID=1144680 RepID=UPI002D7EFA3E|nr:excinuclease ABC subunit UvrA [Luteolibacter yonseiensis]